MLVMGVGGGEMANLLAFLDLPHGKSFNTSSIPSIERELGEFLREAATIEMKLAMEEEVRLTLEQGWEKWNENKKEGKNVGPEPLTYERWKDLPSNHPEKRVAIIVLFDMGWQRRGFCSLSGHGFLIGGRSRKILEVIVSAKECDFCASGKRRKKKQRSISVQKITRGVAKQWRLMQPLYLQQKCMRRMDL
jgi:hypothetical protein